ncbi:MAG: ribonuclease HII [Candidatus Saccharibacteria bacterium]|nr:ribonuclease HII [Candidatus Saccharibacteria bacterium]
MILGIDEVGRGPWAGPLVMGAVLLGDVAIDGLNDSKKLTAKKREVLDAIIREQASAWALGWVSARELDEIGMSEALRLACRRAVEQVQVTCRKKGVAFSEIIIDGTVNFLRDTALEGYVTTMAKADGLIRSVSAASIIAKVARDTYMQERDAAYPGYGFASNMGYGTAAHRAGLERLGACAEHRLSFAPLRGYVCRTGASTPPSSSRVHSSFASPPEMTHERSAGTSAIRERSTASVGGGEAEAPPTTRAIGDAGEQAAAEWLTAQGHEIIARNWRTRWCEIDIVSRRENILFFTEVKYRKNATYGDGLAAITAKKQQQMRFAAELFLAKHPQYGGYDMQLLAADVSGQPPEVQQITRV